MINVFLSEMLFLEFPYSSMNDEIKSNKCKVNSYSFGKLLFERRIVIKKIELCRPRGINQSADSLTPRWRADP